jgi:hypothetical protein
METASAISPGKVPVVKWMPEISSWASGEESPTVGLAHRRGVFLLQRVAPGRIALSLEVEFMAN